MPYLGQNEGFCPGDSTSDGSEKLLQRGTEGKSTHKVLVKGEFSAIKHLIYKRFSAGLEEPVYHEGCFSGYEEMQGLGSRRQFLKISI